jgi:hypothetical protein
VRVLVALTKIDEYDPSLADKLQNISTSHPLRTLMARLSQSTGLPANAIFPIKNLSSEYHPDDSPAVAPLLYRLLHHALLCSTTFLEEECGLGEDGGEEDEEEEDE